MSAEKEKLNVYIDREIAIAIRMESAKLGITQGDLIEQMWEAYQERSGSQDLQDPGSVEEDQAREIDREEIERELKRKQERDLIAMRKARIRKAKEIIDNWYDFDLETVQTYARRMRELGEVDLEKELEDIAEHKRRVI